MRVFDQAHESFLRIRGIKRDVCSTGLEHAEQRDEQLDLALCEECDHRLAADAARAKVPRELVRLLVQLGVGKTPIFANQRGAFGRLSRLLVNLVEAAGEPKSTAVS